MRDWMFDPMDERTVDALLSAPEGRRIICEGLSMWAMDILVNRNLNDPVWREEYQRCERLIAQIEAIDAR